MLTPLRHSRRAQVVAAGAALLVVALGGGLYAGPYPIDTRQIVAALLQPLHLGLDHHVDPTVSVVIWWLRLPRLALAAAVGAGLATAGAAMQALFRNPLADPALVGVSGGAALAAAGVLVFFPAVSRWSLPGAAFVGGLVTTALVYRLARYRGRTLAGTLLLAGLAVNAVVGAGVGLLLYLSTDNALRAITFWMLGGFGRADWSMVGIVLVLLMPSMGALIAVAHRLDLLLLGEAQAAHLGLDVEVFKRWVVILVAVMVGACVAAAGVIGFVGLIVPHWMRLLVGPDHRRLLPGAALSGACLMVVADSLARTLAAPAELPLGILTALVGGPFFLVLVWRNRGHQLW